MQKVLRRHTRSDKILLKVLLHLRHGWSEKRELASELLIPYFNKRDELPLYANIIMWRYLAVILESMG